VVVLIYKPAPSINPSIKPYLKRAAHNGL